MGKYRRTADMVEISGFGGDYEDACNSMFEAGMEHMVANGLEGKVSVLTSENIYGVFFPGNEATESLSKAVEAARPDCSGAMLYAVMNHLAYVAKNGWEKYCEESRRLKK
jgi:hypothetical protein